MYLEDGMSYSVDGDIVDTRDELIRHLRSQIATYEQIAIDDEVLQKENPTVKDAWDKYQTVVKLARQK